MFRAIARWWRWNKPVVYREGKHWHEIQRQRMAYGDEISAVVWQQARKVLEEEYGTSKRGRHSR